MSVLSKTGSFLASLVTFVAVVCLLVAVYGGIRVGINKAAYSKYPTYGIFAFNLNGAPPYTQKEEDCYFSQTYFTEDGKTPRQPTADEKANETKSQQSCVQGVVDSRKAAQITDISEVVFLFILGSGILLFKRVIF